MAYKALVPSGYLPPPWRLQREEQRFPARCPANDPAGARPACLQHCQPGLAQLAPNHRVFSAQLMTMLLAVQGTTLLQGRQRLTTEPAGPDSIWAKNHSHWHTTSSGPDAVVSSSTFQGHKGYRRSWSLGSWTPPHLPMGKQGHRGALIHP